MGLASVYPGLDDLCLHHGTLDIGSDLERKKDEGANRGTSS